MSDPLNACIRSGTENTYKHTCIPLVLCIHTYKQTYKQTYIYTYLHADSHAYKHTHTLHPLINIKQNTARLNTDRVLLHIV